MTSQRTISILTVVSLFLTITANSKGGAAGTRWYVGKWDSTINNLMDHPKTVALRIEVADKETREPIPDAEISFEGEYWIDARTSRHPEGEREAQEMEYKVTCQTDSDGIAVGAFGWQKEHPSTIGVDEVEKAQRIEVRHSRYKYVEVRTPFYRFLEVGQEETWALECTKRDVKFFVLDLGTNYNGFDKKESVEPEFFEKIRDRKWSVVFEEPQNMMRRGMGDGRSWCGPYFVYLIEIQMERRSGQIEIVSGETDQPENSLVGAGPKESNGEPPARAWQCAACGGTCLADAAPNFCPQCGYSTGRNVTKPKTGPIAPGGEEGQQRMERLKRIAENDPLGIAVDKLTPQMAAELFGFPYGLSVNMSYGNLIIRYVLPGSLAEKAGLRKNAIFTWVKLPDQGFYGISTFSAVDDYRKMFGYQVVRDAIIIELALFQFPEGYHFRESDAVHDYFFRTDINWNKGANALNSHFSTPEISENTESGNLADQEKTILADTLKGISETSLPSFDKIKRDPSTLFELMAAFKKAKQDVTIALIRGIPVKDPDTGQMTTFDQFARKAVAGMDLGSAGSFFKDDPIAATYMMVFDKKFLLEKVPLVKMANGNHVSLMDAVKSSDIAGENSEALRIAVDGLGSAYTDGKSGAVLFALEEVVSAVSQLNEGRTVGNEVPPAGSKEKSIDLGNGMTMEFVLIPAGSFYMGSPESEKDRDSDEGPVRRVQITKPFYMGKYEVTQDQYIAVMGTNPSHFSGRNLPVESVQWDEAVAFCEKARNGARLPTEAEWEYSCRSGTETRFSYGDDPDYLQLSEYAWNRTNSERQTHRVGQKEPNSYGLYDMHGNIWEWCADWWAGSYRNAPSVDPTGPSNGKSRVVRGGSWSYIPRNCRSANRSRFTPGSRYYGVGFRIVLDLD